MTDDRYLVEIKSSARRANGAVGRTINREGVHHGFESRDRAETWAADLSDRGERPVWIRRANPNDPEPVDAYLMSRRPPAEEEGPRTPVDGTGDDTGNGGGLAGDWGTNGAEGEAGDDGKPGEETEAIDAGTEADDGTGDGETEADARTEGDDGRRDGEDPPGQQAAIVEYDGSRTGGGNDGDR